MSVIFFELFELEENEFKGQSKSKGERDAELPFGPRRLLT